MYSDDTSFCGIHRTASYRSNSIKASESKDELTISSDQGCNHRSKEDLIECRTPRQDAQMVGLYLGMKTVRLIVLTEKSDHYNTAPEHNVKSSLKIMIAKLLLISYEIFLWPIFHRSTVEPLSTDTFIIGHPQKRTYVFVPNSA